MLRFVEISRFLTGFREFSGFCFPPSFVFTPRFDGIALIIGNEPMLFFRTFINRVFDANSIKSQKSMKDYTSSKLLEESNTPICKFTMGTLKMYFKSMSDFSFINV